MHVQQLMKKEAMDLKESKEVYIRGFGERKVKKEVMWLYYNNKNKRKIENHIHTKIEYYYPNNNFI